MGYSHHHITNSDTCRLVLIFYGTLGPGSRDITMANLHTDEEDLITMDRTPRFKRVPTLGAAVTQIVLCVAQIILVFLLPSLYDKHDTPDRRFGSFSLLIYTHGAHWAAFLIIDQFLHHHHHKSRLQGYLEFYVKTKNVRRAPFYILSIGNAVLMIVVMILHSSNGEVSGCPEPNQMIEVLERQAEMIRYLHEHSENLGRKILLLTSQLSQKERVA